VFPGAPGAPGNTGAPGQPGNDGFEGPLGFAGEQGDAGYTGPAGSPGNRGNDGSQGARGNAGPQGEYFSLSCVAFDQLFVRVTLLLSPCYISVYRACLSLSGAIIASSDLKSYHAVI